MNPQNVLSMAVSLESARYSSPESKLRFYNTLLEKLAALPSVTHVAATTDPPFWGSFPIAKFSYIGQPDGNADSNLLAGFHFVTPGYFSTVQTPTGSAGFAKGCHHQSRNGTEVMARTKRYRQNHPVRGLRR